MTRAEAGGTVDDADAGARREVTVESNELPWRKAIMTVPRALRKSAVVGMALVGLTAIPTSAQASSAAPAASYTTMTALDATPEYAKPDSSSQRFDVVRAGTPIKIQCQTTQTASGLLWYREYDTQPGPVWVYSGHFASPTHPPKSCY
ncbi:hypothetical protein [Streptomyces sp. NPDC093707]|uniref:hypothetical protein n=1 Tax=Streptomyces sp. NPDC093707 TaxID=3154984 RepID=UPI00344CB0C7